MFHRQEPLVLRALDRPERSLHTYKIAWITSFSGTGEPQPNVAGNFVRLEGEGASYEVRAGRDAEYQEYARKIVPSRLTRGKTLPGIRIDTNVKPFMGPAPS